MKKNREFIRSVVIILKLKDNLDFFKFVNCLRKFRGKILT